MSSANPKLWQQLGGCAKGMCGDTAVILMCGTQPSHFSSAHHPYKELVGAVTLRLFSLYGTK